ncbi:MAG: prolyl oligopeptidase family serine peptidase [Gammaproteobacteria bacterium]|jgi:dipeptidyl aminopeptidase/acylaminoacyl peptidase
MPKNIAPYGSWTSPITSALISSKSVTLDQVRIYNHSLYWLERRPEDSGRVVIVSFSNNTQTELLPPPFSARSRVHEYGGGVYCVCEHGVFFVNDADQDIYRLLNNRTERVTTAEKLRFADLSYDARHERILCICEDHGTGGQEPANTLVSVDIRSGEITTLEHGYDFYSNPRASHDGNRLAWLCWNHPNMPWDGNELWLAGLDGQGMPKDPECVAGSESISIFQPEWSPGNVLYFVTDASGWWNLARLEQGETRAVTRLQSEFGLPQWVFGQSTYAFCEDNTIICSRISDGTGQLSLIDLDSFELKDIDTRLNTFDSICADSGIAAYIAASDTAFSQVIKLDTTRLETETIAHSCNVTIDEAYLSKGQSFSFDTRHGDKAYAIYYAPFNSTYQAPTDELPPLIVLSHGGPTGATSSALDLRKQFWTSRGFAIVDVNYSGSTGYGRNYRERLKYNWGIRDVEDVCDAANYFASSAMVDSNRLIIKGSSAGGYTVLAALTFHDTFSCGASYYGISDLETLVADTHKFEARYTEKLIGSYPEKQRIYHQRSPIHQVEKLSCPVIFFQGLEDRVVPPSQAEKMVSALKMKGIPVCYVAFEHEQHGFRRASSIKFALDAELYFYSIIFGFSTADDLPPVHIENVDGSYAMLRREDAE